MLGARPPLLFARRYDLKDHSLHCKYRGATNTSSQIKATFSPDGKSLICGSEDHRFYTWATEPVPSQGAGKYVSSSEPPARAPHAGSAPAGYAPCAP